MSGIRELYQQGLAQSSYDAEISTWEVHYKALLDQLDGEIEEKEAVIRKRILRYFG